MDEPAKGRPLQEESSRIKAPVNQRIIGSTGAFLRDVAAPWVKCGKMDLWTVIVELIRLTVKL